jgi:hypothetical protein
MLMFPDGGVLVWSRLNEPRNGVDSLRIQISKLCTVDGAKVAFRDDFLRRPTKPVSATGTPDQVELAPDD